MISDNTEVYSVMLVEDEEVDATYFKKALLNECDNLEVTIFRDGESAIDYLFEISNEGIRPLPHLVLLDLNLPLRSGFEVLEEIRGDPKLMSVPIVIVSTSSAVRDIQKAYRMKVNAFVKKPDDITGYGKIAHAISVFWLNVALLPK